MNMPMMHIEMRRKNNNINKQRGKNNARKDIKSNKQRCWQMKRMILLAGAIMVAMLAMMSVASAGESMTWVGNITFPNGTLVPHCPDHSGLHCPQEWEVYMENLNETYVTEPWHKNTYMYMCFNAHSDGEKTSEEHWMHVYVTSPDEKWFGETTFKLADAWDPAWYKYIKHFTVYEQSVPFAKDLAPGWNLVSLPRTPDDGSVSAVLASINGNYDSVMKYTPATGFEEVTTMTPGVGYFIRMTEAGTWSYDGYAYESMSVSLSPGLNMVGWVNSDTSLPDALDSIDGSYRYVARWNTTEQEYEVYDPIAPDGFNDFDTMECGVGYFIATTAECTIGYP